ncbi:tol-pal system YbgF family protein [Psychrobacillus sp. NPDC093180]|uniref:tetratricopeptide repeat protein n=1 Tax=Psychrobacillus sp. NPDC093180 TaxID=3364489 RepID=UPI003825D73F
MELHDELYERIVSICSQGDDLVNSFEFENAIKTYLKALDLVPEPKQNWEASTWIYTALGDTCYMNKDYDASKDFLFNAINCPDGIENPFIMLRLGETLYELGDVNKAKEYILRAYILEGYSIFENEEDKYFDVIKSEI